MSSRERLWPVVPGVVGAFLLGMAVRGLASPEPASPAGLGDAPPPRAVDEVPLTAPGPAGVAAGIPVGYARTRDGAGAAAVSYMATGKAFLDMAPAEVEAAVRTMSTRDAGGAILADTNGRLAAARAALAGADAPIDYRQTALAIRVEDYGPDRARVAVWNVGVLSRDGVAPPQAGWAISTFALSWERGDWKVAAEVIEPGPAPVTNAAVAPATAAELSRRLAGFAPFGSRP